MQPPVGLASPSALTVYGAAPDMRDVLFVAVSQSGRSPDLVDSLSVARARGAVSVTVTNDLDSPLAHAAEHAVAIHAGAERALAATKTYTAELLALHLLFGGREGTREAASVPEAAAATLALTADETLAAHAARLRDTERIVVTARGYSYATAREAALKLMETSALEAHILRVGADGDLPIAAGGVPEHLLPILEIRPLQRLAWRLALDRGVDPDRPRGLAKVTQTR